MILLLLLLLLLLLKLDVLQIVHTVTVRTSKILSKSSRDVMISFS
jgi:hypothetical protein